MKKNKAPAIKILVVAVAFMLAICLYNETFFGYAISEASSESVLSLSVNASVYDSTYYVSESFTVKAASTETALYYKTPTMSDYEQYSSLSCSISKNSGDGFYLFKSYGANGFSEEMYVYLDTVPPTVTDDSENYKSGKSGTITVTATDNIGVGVALYNVDGSSESKISEGLASASGQIDAWKYDPGKHAVYYKATDLAGNETSHEVDFEVVSSSVILSQEHYLNDEGNAGSIGDSYANEWFSYTWDGAYGWTATLSRMNENGEYVSLTGATIITLEAGSTKKSGTFNSLNKESLRGENAAKNYTALNGGEYVEGARIAVEGEYKITLDSSSGSNSDTFTIGHCYSSSNYKTPTCSSAGYISYYCFKCGYYNQQNLDCLPHDPYFKITEPTCEEDGYILYWCGNDGCSYNPETGGDYFPVLEDGEAPAEGMLYSEVIPATGHTYELHEHFDGTCQAGEHDVYVCAVCGKEDIRYTGEALPCEYELDLVNSVFPTCTDEGTYIYRCIWCGDEKIEENIPTVEHTWVAAGDEKTDGVTVRKYICSVCGDVMYEEVYDADDAANAVVNAMIGYFDYMWWILLAGVALWAIYAGVKYATSRDEAEAASVRKQIINFAIGIFAIALIVVGIPYLVYGFALLA